MPVSPPTFVGHFVELQARLPHILPPLRSRGWNLAFNDGSVAFGKSRQASDLVQSGQPATGNMVQLTNLLTLLENAAK